MPASKRVRAVRRVTPTLAAALAGLVACAGVGWSPGAAPAAGPPPLVGVVHVGSRWLLRPLDPRTLRPVRGAWSHAVGRRVALARSPLGTGVVAAWNTATSSRAIVVDTRSGRIVRRYTEVGGSTVYWLGGELAARAPDEPFLVAEDAGVCWSLGCGTEYAVVGAGVSEGWSTETVAVLRRRLVIDLGEDGLGTLGAPSGRESDLSVGQIRLPGLPRASPTRVVADVANDRLYAVSSTGVVARVDSASRRPRVSYHRVGLNGRPFEAAWAGRGRIALWGADGLGTIDVRAWTTRAVAPTAARVLATASGLVAWGGEGARGLTLYGADGRLRATVLAGQTVRDAEAVGRYLYVRAGRRYAVDLTAGRVVGRVGDDVRVAGPSFVELP